MWIFPTKQNAKIARRKLHTKPPGWVQSSHNQTLNKAMNTLPESNFQEATGTKTEFNGQEIALLKQHQIVKEFFQTDTVSEMIESLNTMVESFLFSENLVRVTPEMRVHIVNQLRVTTFIAKLERATFKSKSFIA